MSCITSSPNNFAPSIALILRDVQAQLHNLCGSGQNENVGSFVWKAAKMVLAVLKYKKKIFFQSLSQLVRAFFICYRLLF